MAATKRNAMRHEEARLKIKTTQLINRLQNHILGKVEMSRTQISATKILLGKVLPDLSATELNANVEHSYVARMPNAVESADEWQQQYTPPTVN